ncbi:MAG: flagellar biosynthesis protein [Paracoccaceae bacterium]
MSLRLEVFETETPSSGGATVVLDVSALEEAKLASYDEGYSAGWEDANAAQSTEQSQIKTDLARHLQTLGFSYQEARMHVLKAIEPLLLDIVGRLLPNLARETLAPVVLEALMPMAEALADTPVTLVLNPASRDAVEQLLERATGLPLVLQEEPTLGEGQVYLRLGTSETEVNIDRAIVDITAAVRGFFALSSSGA